MYTFRTPYVNYKFHFETLSFKINVNLQKNSLAVIIVYLENVYRDGKNRLNSTIC